MFAFTSGVIPASEASRESFLEALKDSGSPNIGDRQVYPPLAAPRATRDGMTK